jgi:AcrR family transcriptional regulator
MSKAKTADERQRQPTEIRRRLVVTAARGVIARTGLFATTMREIAAAAGVSAGTLTYHFAGIDDLLRAVIDAEMTDFYQPITDKAAAGTGAEALQQLIDGFFSDDERTTEHWRLWLDFWSLSAHDEKHAAWQREVYARWRADVRAAVRRGVLEGEFAIDDLDLAINDFAAMFDGLAVQAYLPTARTGPLQARADLTDWVRRNLAAHPT